MLQTLPASMRFIVRVDILANAGEKYYVDVEMTRLQFKEAGLIMMSKIIQPDQEALETVDSSLMFVRKSRQELDRLQAGHQCGVHDGWNVDCDEGWRPV